MHDLPTLRKVEDMGKKQTCENGHTFVKKTDCPTCLACERSKNEVFFVKVSAPTRRALQNKNINDVQTLAEYSEKEILALHGVGKASLPALRSILNAHNMTFK